MQLVMFVSLVSLFSFVILGSETIGLLGTLENTQRTCQSATFDVLKVIFLKRVVNTSQEYFF